jgi:hypothetical protein
LARLPRREQLRLSVYRPSELSACVVGATETRNNRPKAPPTGCRARANKKRICGDEPSVPSLPGQRRGRRRPRQVRADSLSERPPPAGRSPEWFARPARYHSPHRGEGSGRSTHRHKFNSSADGPRNRPSAPRSDCGRRSSGVVAACRESCPIATIIVSVRGKTGRCEGEKGARDP